MRRRRFLCLFAILALFVAACDNADRQFEAAMVAFELKNFTGAAGLFTYAIESGKLSEPKLAEAYKHRGLARIFIGLHFLAAADLEMALKLAPADTELRYAKAWALLNAGEHQAALEEMNRAVALNSEESLAYSNRCDVRRIMGNRDAALKDCDRAIELDPDFAPAWMERAKLFHDMGYDADARSDINRALQLWPDNPRVRQLARRYGATQK